MLKRFGLWLFKGYCHPDFQEDILGDLDEYYELNLSKKNKRYADRKFFIDIILLFRLSLLKKQLNTQQIIYTAMVKNIFKTTLRIFWKERGYAALNVLGLTVGLAASTLLLLYVESERSVNGFHEDLDQIYQVLEHHTFSDEIETNESNPGPLNTTFKNDFPEVEAMAAFTWPEEFLVIRKGQQHKANGRWASEDFFNVFSVDFTEGSAENALTSPSQLYLSKSTKERLFGEESALSETLELDGFGTFQVAGVFEDIPKQSTITFDFIAPYELWKQTNSWVEGWGNNGIRGIAKLQPNVDINQFNKKIEGYVQEKMGEQQATATIFLQPFKDRYLFNNYKNGELEGGRISYVRLLTAVAVFILLIASINFMNLATARSTKRAKEVGVKKVVGSSRIHLLLQFMTESVLLTIFSALLAGILIMWVIEPLNLLVGKEMAFSFIKFDQSLKLLSMGFIIGIVSGIYPSIILSNFKAINVLKGSFKSSGGLNGLRKGLVVFQFMISTILIISTLVVQKQLHFIKSKDLGYNKDNVVLVPLEGALNDIDVRAQVKSKLLTNPNFTHVAFSRESTVIKSGFSTARGFSWAEKKNETETDFNILLTEHGLLETYNIELLEGRSFDPLLATDSLHIIINEQTARLMNVDEPLNHTVTLYGTTGRVIGIVKDFHFSSLHSSIEPLVISLRPGYSQVLNTRITGQNNQESLAYLEQTLKEFNPNYPFKYAFLDEIYQARYQSEMTIGTLGDYFSGIAIFISLLGLFGLASFAAEQRIKEIGVRKVLGARLINLVITMTKGFMVLVGIGFLIAAPIGYYFMDDWLGAFEYRVNIGASVFIIAGAASFLITILTVSYHALKAAYANPVKNLRYE